jgi:flagellar motor switch protein FliM
VKKVLNQQEIDAILGKARNHPGGHEGVDERVVERCDFRSAGQMSQANARYLTALYEGFARNVSNSLGAYFT